MFGAGQGEEVENWCVPDQEEQRKIKEKILKVSLSL